MPAQVYLLLEYAHGGDLMDCVIRRQRFGEADARKFFRRLLEALDYLHDRWAGEAAEAAGRAAILMP
jgi:serine/threonine protein kinase